MIPNRFTDRIATLLNLLHEQKVGSCDCGCPCQSIRLLSPVHLQEAGAISWLSYDLTMLTLADVFQKHDTDHEFPNRHVVRVLLLSCRCYLSRDLLVSLHAFAWYVINQSVHTRPVALASTTHGSSSLAKLLLADVPTPDGYVNPNSSALVFLCRSFQEIKI